MSKPVGLLTGGRGASLGIGRGGVLLIVTDGLVGVGEDCVDGVAEVDGGEGEVGEDLAGVFEEDFGVGD